MRQEEAKFKAALRDDFSRVFGDKGWSSYFDPGVCTGAPDLLFTAATKIFGFELWRSSVWVEAKVDTELTKIQKLRIETMLRAGNNIRVLRCDMSIPKARRIIEIRNPPDYERVVGVPWCTMRETTFWRELFSC